MTGEPELRLSLDEHLLEQPRPREAAAGTLLAHIAIGLFVLYVPLGSTGHRSAPEITSNLEKATPLLAPPVELTQKEPGKGKPAAEVNLESLLNKPSVAELPSAPRPTRRFIPQPPSPAPGPPKPILEPPKIDTTDLQARNLPTMEPPAFGVPQAAPPPQIQTVEKPKIAFENVGQASGRANNTGAPRIQQPKMPTIQEMGQQMSAGAGGGSSGISVGDNTDDPGSAASMLNPNAPTRQSSNLELLTDPRGVDFKPYLTRILAIVRRNWLAVVPETVRLGRRGRVQVQFAIARDGSVPKLVIAQESGTPSLDRAAVAGIQASTPLPPLPPEFQGLQVRLQFTFLYNWPSK